MAKELSLDRNIGIGMAKPVIELDKVIKIYNSPDSKHFEKISFKQGDHYIDIDHAPSWLNPEHKILDYNVIYLKAISQQGEFLELEVDKISKKTCWFKKTDLRFLHWSEFLFTVNSVEPKNWNSNPVRTHPQSNAPVIEEMNENSILKPLTIQSEWMQVEVLDEDYNP